MRKLLRRLSYLLHRRRLEQDLADELEAHREMMSENRRQAFGNALRLREDSRAAWGWMWLDRLRQDLAYTLRILWRSPGFTLTAISVLALGEGVNLAGVNILDAMFFHRVTVRDASALVRLRRFSPTGLQGASMFSPAATDFYRQHTNSFTYSVTETTGTNFFVSTAEESDPQPARFVSGNYFTALGITPAQGRLLNESDAQPGAPAVAVLDYSYWQQQFGGDPKAVGQVLRLNEKPVTVIGVAPADFKGLTPNDSAFWLPADSRTPSGMLFGKPKPGVTMSAMDAELTTLATALRQQDLAAVEPAEILRAEYVLGIPRKQLPAIGAVIIALVVMVLLAACANLGNILLARGLSRAQEIGIRVAIGAGRWRVIRQLMTENLVLAALGGLLGMLVGHFFARLLAYITDAPPDIRIVSDWRMFAAGGVLTMLAAVAFGFVPAMQAVRPARTSVRARQILVGVQVTVSCVLLILSMLLTRSVQRTLTLDLHFDYKSMVWVEPQFADPRLPPAAALSKLDEIAARLERLPGVDRVTSAGVMPLGNRLRLITMPNSPVIYLNDVAPSYFQAMNLPLVRGRVFRPGETDAVVVSESAARSVWGTEDPIGKTWDVSQRDAATRIESGNPHRPVGINTVVGVVKDSGANLLAAPDSVEAYVVEGSILPMYQTLLVHTTGDPVVLGRQSARASTMPGVVAYAGTLRQRLDRRARTLRNYAALVGLLGGVATLLAAAGIFGLLAFAVAQRTREIGIRVALGATAVNVLRVLAGQYAIAFSAGASAAIALSAAATQAMRSETDLYQLSMRDPAGYLGGLAAFALVALLAALAPALRALRINPATALRWE
jgi:predicted permease